MAACLEINIAENVKLLGIIKMRQDDTWQPGPGHWRSSKLKAYSEEKERSEFINMNEL